MNYIATFKIEDVLTVTTGVLIGENSKLLDDERAEVGLCAVLDHILGRGWRSQKHWNEARKEAANFLFQVVKFPQLPSGWDLSFMGISKNNISEWLTNQKRKFGETMQIPSRPTDGTPFLPTFLQRITSCLRGN